MQRRTFGEAPDELVEEFFCRDLEVEGVAAVFDADVEKLDVEVSGDCGHGAKGRAK